MSKEVQNVGIMFMEDLLRKFMKGKYTIKEFTELVNIESQRNKYQVEDYKEIEVLKREVARLNRMLGKKDAKIQRLEEKN